MTKMIYHTFTGLIYYVNSEINRKKVFCLTIMLKITVKYKPPKISELVSLQWFGFGHLNLLVKEYVGYNLVRHSLLPVSYHTASDEETPT